MRAKIVIATCIVLLASAGLGALGLAYSGVVDVSATAREPALLRWFLETTQQRSVARRVGDIDVPDLGSPGQIREGLEHYQAMCVGCHGAPGIDRDEVGAGLNPRPPRLDEAHGDGSGPARAFWVIRNGIRMTGMPAFGPTHDDDTIWSIVALLQALPDMTAEDYRARAEALGLGSGGEASHHGSHDHGATAHEDDEGAHDEHEHGAEAAEMEPEPTPPSDHHDHGAHEHHHD